MSSNEEDDDITIVSPYHSEYAAPEPGCSPQRIRTGKPRLSETERLHHDVIEHLNVNPIAFYKPYTEKTFT